MGILVQTRDPIELDNAGEFFATTLAPIERAPEFVRLVFSSSRQTISVVLTSAAFEAVVRQIISGPGLMFH